MQYSVTLSGLTPSTVYYFTIVATDNAGSCKGVPGNSVTYTNSFMTATGVAGKSTGGNCPAAVADFPSHSVSVHSSSSNVTFTWTTGTSPSLTTAPTLTTTIFLTPQNGGTTTYTNPTSPLVLGIGALNYKWAMTVAGNCLDSTTLQGTFFGGCAPTELDGTVSMAAAGNPIYDAEVDITSGSTVTQINTQLGGFYSYVMPGCGSSGPVTVWAGAMGFGTYQTASPIALTAFQTTVNDISLPIVVTNEQNLYNLGAPLNPPPYDYDLNNYQSWLSPSVYASGSVSNFGAGLVTISSQGLPQPPSSNNNGDVLALWGTDNSISGAPAVLAYALNQPNLAPPPFFSQYGANSAPSFSAPMDLAFNIYVKSGSPTSNFSVDAILSDGNYLSEDTDSFGHIAYDMQGRSCAASDLSYPKGQWVAEECDVSEFRDLNVSQWLLVYNDPGLGGSGHNFEAYFDSIRLVNAVYPTGISNGGFEMPYTADGWMRGGAATIVKSPPPTGIPSPYDGKQDVLIGTPPSGVCAVLACPTTGQIGQVFRLPNVDVGSAPGSLVISGYYNYNGGCPTLAACQTSSSFFQIQLEDRSTFSTINVAVVTPGGGFSSRGTWQPFSADLTPYAGHVVWLWIDSYSGTYQSDGSYYPDDTWTYLDDISLEASQETVTGESAPGGVGQPYTATMTLPSSTYIPLCGSTHSWSLANSFSADRQPQVTTASYWDPNTNSWVSTPVFANASVGVNAISFENQCSTPVSAKLVLSVDGAVNSTGYVVPQGGGQCAPNLGCANYVELESVTVDLSATMNTTADPNTPPFTATTELEYAQGTKISGMNLSLYAPGPYAAAFYDQEQATSEAVEFVVIGLLIGFLAPEFLPEVYAAAVSDVFHVATGMLQIFNTSSYLGGYTGYGANCLTASGVLIAGTSNYSQLDMACTFNSATSSPWTTSSGQVSLGDISVTVGNASNNPVGGAYDIEVTTDATLGQYSAGPPGTQGNLISTLPTHAVASYTITVDRQ